MTEETQDYLQEYKAKVREILEQKLMDQELSSLDPEQAAKRIIGEEKLRSMVFGPEGVKWVRRTLLLLLFLIVAVPLFSSGWALLNSDKVQPVTLAIVLSTQLIMFITVVWGIVALNRDES